MTETPKINGAAPRVQPAAASADVGAADEAQAQLWPAARHDLRRNGLAALHPQYRKSGPSDRDFVWGRADLADSKASLAQLHSLVKKRHDQKTEKLSSLRKTFALFRSGLFGNQTINAAKDEIESLEVLRGAAASASKAAQDFDVGYKNFHALRSQEIPTDADVRAAHFQRLRAAGNALQTAHDQLSRAADALDETLLLRRNHIKATRTIFRRLRKHSAAYRPLRQQEAARDAFRANLPPTFRRGSMAQRVTQELSRLDELERQLNGVAPAPTGQADLRHLVGDPDGRGPRLRTGIALAALAAGEPLSPALKNTLPQSAIQGSLRHLGGGGFNVVYKAKLAIPDENGKFKVRTYAIKPLDANVVSSGMFGLERRQVRVHARQMAAARTSAALGKNLVQEPHLIEINGQLCMATRLVSGISPIDFENKLARLGAKTYRKVNEGLHSNAAMQTAMKNVQLFHTITGNPDGHGNNLKLRFLDPVTHKTVSFDDIAAMSKADIARLDVGVGLYDLDMAFMPIHDHNPVFKRGIYPKHGMHMRDYFPMRSHYLGPPPYHDQEDMRAVAQLEQDLNGGELGRDLRWSLTNDEQGHDEIGALQSRVAGVQRTMEDQYQAHRRLDAASGRVIDPTDGQPMGPPSQQQAISDQAPKMLSYADSIYGFMPTRRSLMHKFFPLRPR